MILSTIQSRRSCRNFTDEPVDSNAIETILEAATWAPSPLNAQPWEFVVIRNVAIKEEIFAEAERCREWAVEKSGWKWMGKYQVDFLKTVPVMIAVMGDPGKSGIDMFMEGGGVAYEHACAAAIQNMLLTAHDQGLGSLWFTLFDRNALGGILEIESLKIPLAIVCIGKAVDDLKPTPRKAIKKKTTYIE